MAVKRAKIFVVFLAIFLACISLVVIVSSVSSSGSVSGEDTVWIQQFGTISYDEAVDVAIDGDDNIYIIGNSTAGTFPGSIDPLGGNAFVRKYDSTMTPLWTRQWGSEQADRAKSMAVDDDGNVYVVGFTYLTIHNQTSMGKRDAVVLKYDTEGNHLWTRQFGTGGHDEALGVVVDEDGDVYVAGFVRGTLPGQTDSGELDGFVCKYDPGGNQLWTRQFGTGNTDDDIAFDVIVDATETVYAVGSTDGAFEGYDDPSAHNAFLRAYTSNGTYLWTQQFATGNQSHAFAAGNETADRVYVVGGSEGSLLGQPNIGSSDAFVAKYDSTGTAIQAEQFGTNLLDEAYDVTTDAIGNLYMVGRTNGTFPGQTASGDFDAFVVKYDVDANALWSYQLGSPFYDEALGVATDSEGNLYVVGRAHDGVADQSQIGQFDAFIVKIPHGVVPASAPIPTYTPPEPISPTPLDGGWVVQFGPGFDESANDVIVDASGDVYVVGKGSLDGYGRMWSGEALIRKYDASGNELWTRQFGTLWEDEIQGVVLHDDHIYVVGTTAGALPSCIHMDNYDGFLSKYDTNGNEIWTRQFGTDNADHVFDLAVDIWGNLYVVGDTMGAFPGLT